METPQPANPPTSPHASHGHLHTGRRLKKLLRANGRRVHIAATPEEHLHLTRYVKFPPEESEEAKHHI